MFKNILLQIMWFTDIKTGHFPSKSVIQFFRMADFL